MLRHDIIFSFKETRIRVHRFKTMLIRPPQFRVYFLSLLILVQPMLTHGAVKTPEGETTGLCTCLPDQCMCNNCSIHHSVSSDSNTQAVCGCQLRNDQPVAPEKPAQQLSSVDSKFLPQSATLPNPLNAHLFFFGLFSPSQAIDLDPPDPPPRVYCL